MRFSEMERKHQCITCGKQYKQKSSLNKHKTYECGKTPGLIYTNIHTCSITQGS